MVSKSASSRLDTNNDIILYRHNLPLWFIGEGFYGKLYSFRLGEQILMGFDYIVGLLWSLRFMRRFIMVSISSNWIQDSDTNNMMSLFMLYILDYQQWYENRSNSHSIPDTNISSFFLFLHYFISSSHLFSYILDWCETFQLRLLLNVHWARSDFVVSVWKWISQKIWDSCAV